MDAPYQPHIALIERSLDLTPRTKAQIKIIAYQVDQFNKNNNPTASDLAVLNQYIDDFIYDQVYQAVNSICNSPDDLLDLWVDKSCIVRPKIVRHRTSGKKAIRFYTRNLPFRDFYNVQKQVFPNYSELYSVFSTICYNLFENISKSDNVESFLADYSVLSLNINKNPHAAYLVDKKWEKHISFPYLYRRKHLQNVLCSIANHFFPQHQFNIFSGFALKQFLWMLASGESTNTLFSLYLTMIWLGSKNLITPNIFTSNASGSKTRDVRWCIFENKNYCSKLEIECHSSIDCPFYQRADYKKLK